MDNRIRKKTFQRIFFIALSLLLLTGLCSCVAAADIVTSPNAAQDVVGVDATTEQNPVISAISTFFTELGDKLYQNFIDDDRYQYIIIGLQNTIIITIFSLIMGMLLGALLAVIRTVHDLHGKLKIANAICRVYLAIVRGTPVMLQLLIIYFVIFAAVDVDKVLVAIVAFGLNSAAYIAEIIRAGINAVPKGQFEAGASLGLPFTLTMITIIFPQAIKNILPALCNEGITLLKETAISGYIGLVDLTKAGDIIRSQTWEAFIPLLSVAAIYLVIVLMLTYLVQKLERRLNNAS